MFALDTNVIIHYFQQKGRVAERLRGVELKDVAIPAIVHYELEIGAARSEYSARRRKDIDSLMRVVRVLEFDSRSAVAAALVRSTLEARKASIGSIDFLIAGTAIAHGATLVTHNTAEFKRVPGLKIVDWY